MRNVTSPPQIFDRKRWRARRSRSGSTFASHDFLHRRVMTDIVDRLETVKRDFPKACLHGVGHLVKTLTPACGIGDVIICDGAASRIEAVSDISQRVVYDEELMPFQDQQFDLVVSLLTLHSVNDLIGSLIQYRRCLRPDGLFIAAVFSGETLGELKRAFTEAEIEITGGLASRFHPMADVRQWGNALSRAGFALPVTDIDTISVEYKSPATIITDLRAMAETSVLAEIPKPLARELSTVAFKKIDHHLTFEVTFLTAWAPHPSQPKPLKPGAGKVSLTKFFEGDER